MSFWHHPIAIALERKYKMESGKAYLQLCSKYATICGWVYYAFGAPLNNIIKQNLVWPAFKLGNIYSYLLSQLFAD